MWGGLELAGDAAALLAERDELGDSHRHRPRTVRTSIETGLSRLIAFNFKGDEL
jgi:hypothetical protein